MGSFEATKSNDSPQAQPLLFTNPVFQGLWRQEIPASFVPSKEEHPLRARHWRQSDKTISGLMCLGFRGKEAIKTNK